MIFYSNFLLVTKTIFNMCIKMWAKKLKIKLPIISYFSFPSCTQIWMLKNSNYNMYKYVIWWVELRWLVTREPYRFSKYPVDKRGDLLSRWNHNSEN